MSTRTLTSISITNPSLIRSRYPIRLVECCAVASSHARSVNSIQVRTFWGRGWKYAWYHNYHNRSNRREILHDLAKDYRGQYVFIKRMANRRSGKHQFWRDWKDSLKQSHRERDDIWRDSKRHRHYWDGDMSELVKRIEKDPYNFLFGRSNEYLKMGKGWSSFCRSFLDPEPPSEQKLNTSSAQEHSVKNTTDDVSSKTSTIKADDDAITVRPYKPSDANSLRYDPISGRMKPVGQPATEVTRDETKDDSHITDIPVKVFTSPNEVKSDNTEIFGQESPKPKDTVPAAQDPKPQVNNDGVFYMAAPSEDSPVTSKYTSKMPTKELQQSKDASNGQKKKLHYEPKEVTEDDVDLLRASDVRASFFAGETKQELAEKKKQAREAMEQEYSLATNQNIDDEILQGLRQKKEAVKETAIDTETPTDTLERVRLKYIPQAEKLGATYRGDDSNTLLVSNATSTTDTLRASLEGLLEDTRRFINDVQLLTNDIQNACERVEASTNIPVDTLRILAFDSVNSQVVCAETTSSMHTNEPIRHAADVLLDLNNPAKFLPYFAKMKADGYEIVSGGGDILIFRKTATNGSESAMADSADVEQLMISTKGKIGSGTETLVSKDSDSLSQPTDRSKSRIVQRQETVFTGGPPNWSPYQSPSSPSSATEELEYTQTEPSTKTSAATKLGKGIRRIVLSGVATAGTFYAIGVVCEYFLTGGQDGLGPEGFTEFEAERRRRE
ncbi:hypothetical protein DPV78_000869 [Talaromyces pinophilus]|nr:hypothetical protein DPV78_000869 [Talaromyces pinophilus]